MRDIVEYELGPIPRALARHNGQIWSTPKSKIVKDIEKENTVRVFDAMVLIQARACNFTKKETLAQVFSCEFCEISKNSFSYRTPPVAASG